MKPSSQRGVALVITLIMLAVVTFMATAFLTLSRRERGSVKVSTDQSTAQMMAEMGTAQAVAQTAARIIATSNLLHYDLIVSTNFINPIGFQSGLFHPTNVAYFRTDGSPITNRSDDIVMNCGNLFYSPRAPVYAPYQYRAPNGQTLVTNEFRYYYDLNRNGLPEPSGLLPVLDNQGKSSGQSNFFVGDPEWIGVLQQPDLRHSPTNRFIGRYAFFAVPTGKALDVNRIHNAARVNAPNPNVNGYYYRNQGVGPWEMNFAAFLCDLNTNLWPITAAIYSYTNNPGSASGLAFRDAHLLTQARTDYRQIAMQYTLKAVYTNSPAVIQFVHDGIDTLSDGPPMLKTQPLNPSTEDRDDLNVIWAGSDNLSSFTDIQQLLSLTNQNLTFTNLVWGLEGNHPNNRRTRSSSYDRYTFYRMLAQLGVDSAPERSDKININYRNYPSNNFSLSATNLTRWNAQDFFTVTADKLLRAYYGLSITNIRVYPYTNSQYGAGVHRLLQVAANIYDATSTNTASASVFKPVFAKTGTNVIIVGYTNVQPGVVGLNSLVNRPWRDLNYTVDFNALQPMDNVHGVPYVIGAKQSKAFIYPNFNEASMQTVVQLTRKLEVRKPNNLLSTRPVATNQMYILGISNVFGVEGWNSHSNAVPGLVRILLTNQVTMALVQSNRIVWPNNQLPMVRQFSAEPNRQSVINWPSNTFAVHLMTNVVFLTNAIYSSQTGFRPSVPAFFEYRVDLLNRTNPVMLWVTNRLQYLLVDDTRKVLLDYVTLNNLVNQINLTDVLLGADYQRDDVQRALWQSTNGIMTQAQISLGNIDTSDAVWRSYTADPVSGDDKNKAIDRFRLFVGLTELKYTPSGQVSQLQREATSSPVMQTPFNPSKRFVSSVTLQVNDPLVHYTIEDLLGGRASNSISTLKPTGPISPPMNVGMLNEKYRPWGGNPNKDPSNDTTAYNVAIKDPLVSTSDQWEFPNQPFPNVGWLGRVHRGTPWQTIYLKAPVTDVKKWTSEWAGRADTHPTNDWWLLDFFTTAPHDNATTGLLSVNQTNLAAWSAVLSGVSVLTNSTTEIGQVLVAPGSRELTNIVAGINAMRASWPGQVFPIAGSILSAPALTTSSPFLNPSQIYGPGDAVYERIPQQILSLLKADEPRLTIYALGQTLRPAQNSLVLEPGPNFRLCTNYQVTAEIATKTVLRFEGNPNNPQVVQESFRILPVE
jgi:hypothetical protein